MKIIGFNFNKIIAQKNKGFKLGALTTNIEFIEIEKEKVEVIKDSDTLKMDFNFSILYKDSKEKNAKLQGEVTLQGALMVAVSKEESKSILDAWKKKQVLENIKKILINFILKKCTVKTLSLQEELNLPSHIKLPRLG